MKRDLLLAWSYRLQFIAGIFSGIVSLALFYYISRLVHVEQFSPAAYFAFVTVGIVIFSVLVSTMQIPQMSLRQELVAGTFERIVLAPRGAAGAIVSLLIYPTLYALLTMTVELVIAAAVFELPLVWSTALLAIPIGILSVFAFAPLGILLLASVVFSKRSPPGYNYLIAGLSLVAGLYFPIALLPDWIQWASKVQPLTPATELLRYALVGQPLDDPAWLLLAKLAAFAVIALPASWAVLRTALYSSRRRGTILEY